MPYMDVFLLDPAATIKNVLRFLHFVGLAMGLGAATLLDLTILRFFFRKPIGQESIEIVEFASRVVDLGLKILWITGFGFLLHYAILEPAKLANPKIYAKLAIVATLTLNGAFIHAVVLPGLRAQKGRFIFSGVTPARRFAFILSGAISVVSWYVPVMLGAFSQLNHAVPAAAILTVYVLLVAWVAVAMHFLTRVLHASEPEEVEEIADERWLSPTLRVIPVEASRAA